MTRFIDTIVSSTLWFTIITMVWMFAFVGLSFYNPFKNKTLNFLYKAAMYAVAGLIMAFPLFTYYGLADGFEEITIGKNTVCLLEKYERGGGESSSESVSRMTVLDKNTGERKDRRYIGYTGELLAQKGDTVAYMYNEDFYLMNAFTLKEIGHIKKEEWEKKFPELADGVEQVYDNTNYNGPHKIYIMLKGKNGNNYWYNPFDKKLLATEPQDQGLPGIYSNGYDLYRTNGKGQDQRLLIWDYVNNSERKKISPGDGFKNMFGPTVEDNFIDPAFLCIDTVKKCFVFRHYTTTDKDKIWVEARDFNFKLLWKKTSQDLEATDSYNTDRVDIYKYAEGLLYFDLGGFMLCMEPASGKIKWKVRL